MKYIFLSKLLTALIWKIYIIYVNPKFWRKNQNFRVYEKKGCPTLVRDSEANHLNYNLSEREES